MVLPVGSTVLWVTFKYAQQVFLVASNRIGRETVERLSMATTLFSSTRIRSSQVIQLQCVVLNYRGRCNNRSMIDMSVHMQGQLKRSSSLQMTKTRRCLQQSSTWTRSIPDLYSVLLGYIQGHASWSIQKCCWRWMARHHHPGSHLYEKDMSSKIPGKQRVQE